jgi:endogenous inhibitor of DNA gyrase (YacG/DUF329 family)
MRAPIACDDVILRGFRIVTLPRDAFDESWKLIPGVVEPLVEELRERSAKNIAEMSDEIKQLVEAINGEPASVKEPLTDMKVWVSEGEPRGLLWWSPLIRCKVCRRMFIYKNRAGSPIRFCSDKCKHRRLRQHWKRSNDRRGEERARDRRSPCAQCGNPIDSDRSTKRFCSNRCRLAAWRADRLGSTQTNG